MLNESKDMSELGSVAEHAAMISQEQGVLYSVCKVKRRSGVYAYYPTPKNWSHLLLDTGLTRGPLSRTEQNSLTAMPTCK